MNSIKGSKAAVVRGLVCLALIGPALGCSPTIDDTVTLKGEVLLGGQLNHGGTEITLACVECDKTLDGYEPPKTTSGVAGDFQFTGLAKVDYEFILESVDNYDCGEGLEINLEQETFKTIECEPKKGTEKALSIEVCSEQGIALDPELVEVEVASEVGLKLPFDDMEAPTGRAQGECVLVAVEGVKPGFYEIRVAAEGAGHESKVERLEVKFESDETVGVRVDLRRVTRTETLKGLVGEEVAGEFRPLERVAVEVREGRDLEKAGETNPAGFFALDVRASRYSLTLSRADLVSVVVTVEVDPDTGRLVFGDEAVCPPALQTPGNERFCMTRKAETGRIDIDLKMGPDWIPRLQQRASLVISGESTGTFITKEIAEIAQMGPDEVISGLAPGRYRVQISRDGFLDKLPSEEGEVPSCLAGELGDESPSPSSCFVDVANDASVSVRLELVLHDLARADLNLTGVVVLSEDLKDLAERGNLSGANLSGALLVGDSSGDDSNCLSAVDCLDEAFPLCVGGGCHAVANLCGLDLTGVNLSNARIDRGNFIGARLDQADLAFALIEGGRFNGASLSSASLFNTRMEGADFSGIDEGCDGYEPKGRPSDLRNADLSGADLKNAIFVAVDEDALNVERPCDYDAHIVDVPLVGCREGEGVCGRERLNPFGNFAGATFDFADLEDALIPRGNFAGVDLSSARIKGVDLRSACLKDANLVQTDLTNANLEGADLTRAAFLSSVALRASFAGARLDEADFTGANLEVTNFTGAVGRDFFMAGAIMTGTRFTDAHFRDVYMPGLLFNSVDLSGVVCDRCDLRNSTFLDVGFEGALFRNARLDEVSLRAGELVRVDFSGANLSFADLRQTTFEQVLFDETQLIGTIFRNAEFNSTAFNNIEAGQNVDFERVIFHGDVFFFDSDLSSSSFANATFEGSEASPLIIRDLDLADADLTDLRFQSGVSVTSTNLRDALLVRADLRRADVVGCDLRGADLSGARLLDEPQDIIDPSEALPEALTNFEGSIYDAGTSFPTGFDVAGIPGLRLIRDNTDLSDTDLSGMALSEVSLEASDLRGATLNNTTLEKAELKGASLRQANAVLTVFKESVLRGVDMREALIRSADMRGADLRGADLTGAALNFSIYDDDTRWPEGFVPGSVSDLYRLAPGQTLTSAELGQLDLSGSDLSGVDLSRARLERANLSFANLSGAATMTQTVFDGASLRAADLNGSTLDGASLFDADLDDADLRRADLSGAILWRASLIGVVLDGADLRRASLREAILEPVSMAGIELEGAYYDEFTDFGGDFTEADLSQMIFVAPGTPDEPNDLSGVDLSFAQLAQVSLRFSNLSGANLSGANLFAANLRDANLSDTDLSGADLELAIYDARTRWPDDLDPDFVEGLIGLAPGADLSLTDLSFMDLSGADLAGADLTGADLAFADLTGTLVSEADLSGVSLLGADLSSVRGLSAATLDSAYIDEDTRLPLDDEARSLMESLLDDGRLYVLDFGYRLPDDAQLQGAHLRDRALGFSTMRGANLTDANLEGASLVGADLTGASLSGAHLKGASLFGADLTDANLDNAQADGALLSLATLTGADLIDADLEQATLEGVSLDGANFTGATLDGAALNYSQGASTHFALATMTGAFLAEVVLDTPNFTEVDLSGADLSSAAISSANFDDAILNSADLSGAQISVESAEGATWARASLISSVLSGDLSGASMTRVNLRDTDLTSADLTDVDFAGAIFDNETCLPQGFTPTGMIFIGSEGSSCVDPDLIEVTNPRFSDLSGADLKGADLSGVDMTGSDLTDTDLRRANLRGATLKAADLSGADLSFAYYDAETAWPSGFDPVSVPRLFFIHPFELDPDEPGGRLITVDRGDFTEVIPCSAFGAQLEGAALDEAELSQRCLIGANLRFADLSGADLKGVDFTDADLKGAIFDGAVFDEETIFPGDFVPEGAIGVVSGGDLRNEEIVEIDLSGADLNGANLSGAFFFGVDLRGANLNGANLQDITGQGLLLQGADLSNTRLDGANLDGADLRGANLRGASFEGANLSFVDLSRANLRGANLRGAQNLGAVLSWRHAYFDATTLWPEGFFPEDAQREGAYSISNGADLTQAQLQRALLASASLQRVNLIEADLRGAFFSNAIMVECDLRGADLRGAELFSTQMRRCDLRGADLRGAHLFLADLRGANLTGADLSGTEISCARFEGADLSGANLEGARFFCEEEGRLSNTIWDGTNCPDGTSSDDNGQTCEGHMDCAESCREICLFDQDLDGDGLEGCDDTDCTDAVACSEIICDDGLDFDGNALVDCKDLRACGAEPDCLGEVVGASCSEGVVRLGGSGQRALDFFFGNEGSDLQPGSCGGGGQPSIFLFSPRETGTICVDTQGAQVDTVLYVRHGDCEKGREVACNDDIEGGVSSQLSFEAEEGEVYHIFVDTFREDVFGDIVLTHYPCEAGFERICDDGQDTDEDQRVDCDDPDCFEAEACLESGHCEDGQDNDGDGLTDCLDPDCLGEDACVERDCFNDQDDDGDGLEDCLDPDCDSDDDCVERDCGDNFDNEGDGLTDCADPDCREEDLCLEVDANCQDNQDNDLDGLTDCDDPTCRFARGCTEICDDDQDNNGDGLNNCLDPICNHNPACPDAAPSTCQQPALIDGFGAFIGTTAGRPALHVCSEDGPIGTGAETVWRLALDISAQICIDTLGSPSDTVLHIREGTCEDELSQIACNDDVADAITQSQLQLDAQADEVYFIFVDSFEVNATDPFVLNIAQGPCPPIGGVEICDDGQDNDNDARIDCRDDDCFFDESCEEICDDDLDNDLDGLIDCLDDACTGEGEVCGEVDCGDDLDNDRDGQIDCDDTDCQETLECEEICDDGVDNNANGSTDCEDDACFFEASCVEDCADGVDNNANGLIDCFDTDCADDEACDGPLRISIAPRGQTIEVAHETISDRLWSRPLASCLPRDIPQTFPLEVIEVSNDTGAPARFDINAQWRFDGFIHIFSDPIDPNSPEGCLAGNNDFEDRSQSRLTNIPIAAGETLHIAVSTYLPGGFFEEGAYTLRLSTIDVED